MQTDINEQISVGAIFSSGKIRPRFFIWKQMRYEVEKITYFWRSKVGSMPIIHFAVICNGFVYEISYNSTTFDWHLEKIIEN